MPPVPATAPSSFSRSSAEKLSLWASTACRISSRGWESETASSFPPARNERAFPETRDAGLDQHAPELVGGRVRGRRRVALPRPGAVDDEGGQRRRFLDVEGRLPARRGARLVEEGLVPDDQPCHAPDARGLDPAHEPGQPRRRERRVAVALQDDVAVPRPARAERALAAHLGGEAEPRPEDLQGGVRDRQLLVRRRHEPDGGVVRVDDLPRDEIDGGGAGLVGSDALRVQRCAQLRGEIERRRARSRGSLRGAPGERGRDEREDQAPDQRRVMVTVRLPQPERLVQRREPQVDPQALDRRARVRGDAGPVAGDVHAGAERDDGRVHGHDARPRRQSARGSTVRRVGRGHDGQPGARPGRGLDGRRGRGWRGRRGRGRSRSGRGRAREALDGLGVDGRDGRRRFRGPRTTLEVSDPLAGQALLRAQARDVGGPLGLPADDRRLRVRRGRA